MTRFTQTIAASIAVVLTAGITLAAGLTYGKLSNRWGPPANIAAIASKIEALPEEIGPWKCVKTLEVSDEVMTILDAHAMVHRVYENQETKEQIRMFVVIGPPGPISVHTPEICYPSSTYEIQGQRKSVSLPDSDRDDSFWSVDFRGTDVHAGQLRAYYAWTTASRWQGSANPRWDFAGMPYLVKIQAVTNLPRQEQPGQTDPVLRFFESFAPQYERHISDPTTP